MPQTIETLLNARHSVRAFLDRKVPKSTIENILRAARSAPSGANLQPGRFHVLSGSPLQDLSQKLVAAHVAGRNIDSEYSYFPAKMSPDLKARQRQAGYALYAAQGIERRDIAARKKQFEANYRFFDAPVGIVVTIERDMGKGCFMDLGFSLMALMLSAQDHGLGTTGIGALANHATIIQSHLNLPEHEMVVCGIALGVEDVNHPINNFKTDRLALDDFTTFAGFKD